MAFYDTSNPLKGMNHARALQMQSLQNEIQSSQNYANAQKELIGQGAKTLSDTFGSILKTVSDHQEKKQRKENFLKALQQGGADKRYIAMAQNMNPDDAIKLMQTMKQYAVTGGNFDPFTGTFTRTTEGKKAETYYNPIDSDVLEMLRQDPELWRKLQDSGRVRYDKDNGWTTNSQQEIYALVSRNASQGIGDDITKNIAQATPPPTNTDDNLLKKPFNITDKNIFDKQVKEFSEKIDQRDNRAKILFNGFLRNKF